jgi:hypothetical protein
MKTALLVAVATAAVAACAAAPAMAGEVEIRDAVARVVVIVEDRNDIAVEITHGGSRLPALQVRRNGHDVRIDGRLGRNGVFGGNHGFRNCRSGAANARQPGEGASVEVRDIGRVRLEDAPMIVLRTPRDVEVSASGAVFGAVGRGARSVDLGSGGCGDWAVANVDGRMQLSVGGSGSIRAGTSRELEASVGGSGSIAAGATRKLEASVGGSGDITVARVDGEGEVAIGGSGNVAIRDGRMPAFSVAIGGSGDVRYGGATRDLEVAIAGSGDVSVGSATGQVQRSVIGSGTVNIGR